MRIGAETKVDMFVLTKKFDTVPPRSDLATVMRTHDAWVAWEWGEWAEWWRGVAREGVRGAQMSRGPQRGGVGWSGVEWDQVRCGGCRGLLYNSITFFF